MADESFDHAPGRVRASTTTSSPDMVTADTQPERHVQYALAVDTASPADPTTLRREGIGSPTLTTGTGARVDGSGDGPRSPTLLRRAKTGSMRAPTFKPVSDYDEFDSSRPGWEPGQEPGFDPARSDAGHSSMATLYNPTDVTIVDFSRERLHVQHYDNEGFVEALAKPQPDWAKCRWINVNQLSWDVVQAIGSHKQLHQLALEDIFDPTTRTKVDWFPTHCFVSMTLQKIVYLIPDRDSDSDSSSDDSLTTNGSKKTIAKSIRRALSRKKRRRDIVGGGSGPVDPEKHPYMQQQRVQSHNIMTPTASGSAGPHPSLHSTTMIRTLQRFQASSNEARTEFMEAHQSLSHRGLAVSAERVSIFLTSDNTVISFFEASASDVERPIIKRLSTPSTILRQSCDASMVLQAVIDAIIDLAMPLTTVYNDVLGDIEMAVLTDPSIKQSKSLYIVISEINKMLGFLNPIDNMINVLRDHRTQLTASETAKRLQDPTSGVIISPMTHTYLGDALDHCITITEAMQQIKASADNLIGLIFNTNSAYVNDRMKQLTTISMIFLPLTFITGFFGQNFAKFPEIEGSIGYFWICAVPTVFATMCIIMFSPIKNSVMGLRQRYTLWLLRREKRKEDRRRMRKRRRE